MKKKPTKVPKFKRLPHLYKMCVEFAFKLTNEFHTIFHQAISVCQYLQQIKRQTNNYYCICLLIYDTISNTFHCVSRPYFVTCNISLYFISHNICDYNNTVMFVHAILWHYCIVQSKINTQLNKKNNFLYISDNNLEIRLHVINNSKTSIQMNFIVLL